MRHTLRTLLAACIVLLAVQWSRPAWADVTGVVGEVGTVTNVGDNCRNGTYSLIRFKLTDPTQTAACGDSSVNANGATTKYAYVIASTTDGACQVNPFWKEMYAMLLYSKKGAPISCTIASLGGNGDCHVTDCKLP